MNRGKAAGVLIAVVALSALAASHGAGEGPSALPDPYSAAAIAKKNYRNVTLNVLSLEKPVQGEPVELHARQFEKLTGATVTSHFVPFHKLYQELLYGLKH